MGGTATASGSNGANVASRANDGNPSTYWQSSTTMGWLAIEFARKATIDEVHAHFNTTPYPTLSLYLDTNGDGSHELKVWTKTDNPNLDVVIGFAPTAAHAMKITVDAKVGSNLPRINEFEAYLRYDSDGDGLTNGQEALTWYYQDMSPGGLPQAIPDDGANSTASAASLVQFYGMPSGALANFTVDHPRKTDLTAQIGYWNGSAWVDRYVWDPGKHLLAVGITQPTEGSHVDGVVTVVATVEQPEITKSVDFRVNGTLTARIPTPVGNEYRWDWNTTAYAEGPWVLNVTQVDVYVGRAWDEHAVVVDHPPTATWVSPAENEALPSGAVTVKVRATDFQVVQRVRFLVDDEFVADDFTPDSGTYDYSFSRDTAGWPNGAHVLKAVVSQRGGLAHLTTITRSVTTSNDPWVHITSPAHSTPVRGTIQVRADASSTSSSISKIEFWVDGNFRSADTGAPYTWDWITTGDPDGWHALTAKAYRSSDSKVAAHSIEISVENGGGCPGCPLSPLPAADEMAGAASSGSQTLGVLTSYWSPGEVDDGTTAIVVVDLTSAPPSFIEERVHRIFRPGFPASHFATYLQWRLVIRDWVLDYRTVCLPTGLPEDCWQERDPKPGNLTAFILRSIATSDPAAPDTDGDTIWDGTETSVHGTLPVTRDSDLDGLSEDYEIKAHTLTVWTGGMSSILAAFTTDPAKWDTDGDGLSDGQERGNVTTGQSKVIGEVGQVKNLGATWTTVYLRNKYTTPVVIAEPTTFRDKAFGHVRIQAVTDHTFQLKIETWVSGGSGALEDVTYLVVETGNHMLPDGTIIEAGTKTGIGASSVTVAFREAFAATPIVLVQSQTSSVLKVVAKRTNAVAIKDFAVYLNANGTTISGSETVGYVAIAPQADPNVLATWTRAEVGLTVNPGTWAFPAAYSSAPLVVAWMKGDASNRNIGLRLESVTNSSVTIRQEQALGTAPLEAISFLVFAGPMNLTARMTTKPNDPNIAAAADTDGDGLSDGTEVNTHGSNPTLKDTDLDGLADNVEAADRTFTVPVNGTARTFTFKTSPTSDDTDADGVKDPDELNGILEHRNLFLDMATLRTSGILRDLSGNGGDGTVFGATCTSTVSGRLGSACSFGGTSARIQVPDSTLLDLTSSFTIMAWVYPTTTAQPSGAGIVAKGTGGGGEAYTVDVTSGKFRALFWKAGASYVAQGTTAIAANTWFLVAAVYDGPSGKLRLYVNAGSPTETLGVPSSLATNDHVVSIGSREGSATSGYNLGFIGRIDEVQIWDRPLSLSEISAYRNITNGGSPVAWLDMDTRDSSSNLFDFSATGHPGSAAGTTVVEGRTGFARRFAAANDGISVVGSGSLTFGASTGTGVTVDAYVLMSSRPGTDVSVVARKGQFYLNVTSDGRVQWSLYKSGVGGRTVSVTWPVPLPLNRWVQITGTAVKQSSTVTLLSLYVDGAPGPQAYGRTFPSASSLVTIGYTEGQSHFVGAIDEVLVLGMEAASTTIQGRTARGILLNPNATDTDGDGLADGQELYVKSVKTPKRYPTGVFTNVNTGNIDPAVSAPAWAIARVDGMVGFTHPDMSELSASLYSGGVSPSVNILLRAYSNAGEANNFTSYDLLQKPAMSGAWLTSEDFVKGGRTWYLSAYDRLSGKSGQIEYLQLQVTVRTFPNRADTDADGLNDAEELNLGSDGFATDPWKPDTDGDTIPDAIEYAGWSRSGSTIMANSGGFHTDPTRADTDLDGYADGVDRWPLQDAYVEVYVDYFQVITRSVSSGQSYPYVTIEDAGGNKTVSWAYVGGPCADIGGGWFFCSGRIDHLYTLDIPDTAPSVTFTFELRQNLNPDVNAPISPSGSNRVTSTWNLLDGLAASNPSCGGSSECTFLSQTLTTFNGVDQKNNLRVIVTPRGGTRSPFSLIVPRDYAGIYNVTDSVGTIVGRRYLGEPRFVQVLINGSSPTNYLIPRSLFFDTKFSKDLQTQAVLQAAPYTKMKGYQNGTTSANSDVLQMAYVFDGLSAAEATAVRDFLLANGTGVVNKTLLTWTSTDWVTINSPYLLGLPSEIIQAVPLLQWYSSPSHPENIDVAQPAVPFWVQLVQGIASAIAQTLQWIHSALVWVANMVVQFLEALRNFGSWLGDLTSGDPVRVRNAVQAAQKALDGFVSWIIDGAISLFRSGLAYVDIRLIANSIIPPVIPIDGSGLAAGAIEAFLNAVFSGWFFYTLVGVGLLLQLVATYLTIQSFGAALVASHVILPKLIEILVQTWLKAAIAIGVSLAITASIAAMLYLVLPNADPFWREGLGLSFISVALAVEKSPQIIKGFRADPTGVARELFGFAIAFIGLIVAFSLGDVTGAFWGFVLAAAGAAITLVNRDAFDISPVSPLKNIEEITSVVSLAYASANLAKEITT